MRHWESPVASGLDLSEEVIKKGLSASDSFENPANLKRRVQGSYLTAYGVL